MNKSYDAVVIGSGFGGAITACRLAQAGRSVCLLEQGQRWKRSDFPRSPYEVVNRAFWNEQQRPGFIEYRSFPRMDVIYGCGVGGGSLHYFNVNLWPASDIFDDLRWPRNIGLGRLKPYYRLSRKMLDAEPLQPEERDLPLRTRAFWAAAEAYGTEPELLNIAVYTRAAPRNSQSACIYCGDCLLGCQVHAKNTLDLNYIPLAEQYGAEVVPQHKAEFIEPNGKGYTVHVSDLRRGAAPGARTFEVSAQKVVVAAGTLGSNELLLKSRDVYKTLPRLSEALGQGFSGNGDYLLAGTFYHDTVVDPSSGPSITAGLSLVQEGQRICIQDLGYSDPLLWYINGSVPTFQRWQQLTLLGWDYLLSSLGVKQQGRMDAGLDRLLRGGITTNFLPYLGMGTDAADGSLALDQDDRIVVHWDHSKSLRMFQLMERCLEEISRSSGGTYLRSPLWEWPIRKLLTAHPLGGCAMSDREQDGVVDEFGQVWNYPNLYVADGSIIPTALAVNPSATISALAERVAFYMIHGREIGDDDERKLASSGAADLASERSEKVQVGARTAHRNRVTRSIHS